MTSGPTSSGRRSTKQEGILTDLRNRIISGAYVPGTRLPTRKEFQATYQLSSITVQSALDALIADGFIIPRGRLGTFVTERPPHLHRFGLVIAGWYEDLFFWKALAAVAQELNKAGTDLRIYTRIDGRGGDEEQRLMADLRAQRLAGVVLTSSFMADTEPLARFPDIPQVAIMGPIRDHARLSAVQLDWESFITMSLDHFVSRGCKRLALIGAQGHGAEWLRSLSEKARARHIQMRPHWTHFLSPSPTSDSAQSLTHLLFHPDQRECPDCLLISDDHLVESASIGLVAAQRRVPGDVEVVGHSNFPLPSRAKVPITHIGYRAGEIMASALEMLGDMRRSGERRVPDRRIPARVALD